MMCAWKELLAILPLRLRPEVDRLGKDTLQELRLRVNEPPALHLKMEQVSLQMRVTQEDVDFVVNTASRYSPWTCETLRYGYLTAPGGHRIGVCGAVIVQNEVITGIRQVRSLCIRVARDFPGISGELDKTEGNLLILGPPGSGKTTLLRDMIRKLSVRHTISVVDERQELFPKELPMGRADVLSGCNKAIGMEMLLKTMGPEIIAIDEITSDADCQGLVNVANCGVRLLATAHAGSLKEFREREIYRSLLTKELFDHVIVLNRSKTFTVERMTVCT